MIIGQGVSKGYGIGKIYRYENNVVIPDFQIEHIEDELSRLNVSVEHSVETLKDLYESTLETLGEDKAQLFKAHELMLKDPEFLGAVKEKVKSKMNAEQAVLKASNKFSEMFLQMDNEYFRERAADIKDISNRLIFDLMGVKKESLSEIAEGTVLLSHDLSPSDTSQLKKENIVGIITEIGGETSHSAIIARTLGIPAIMGIGNQTDLIKNDMSVVIDGDKGQVILEPSMETIDTYLNKIRVRDEYLKDLELYKNKNYYYTDGRKIEVAGNIALPEESENVLNKGGQGVGLFRSEFIYMNRQEPPTEEEQYLAYKQALEGMNGHPVTIRTMDIGGDKEVDYLHIDKELNPFLGYRAIRYCFDHRDFFKVQLRALYRASIHGQLRIMFPMVSKVEEIITIKEIIQEVKDDLYNDKVEFNSVEIGIMIEVPSAAVMSDVLAKYVDFASIGTNDLTQYTLASDRMNQNVKSIYSNYDPSVIRLIHMTIENFHKAGKWVGMCGSAAGNKELIPVWYAMGLDEFSMVPNSILEAKATLDKISDSKISLEEILEMGTEDEVRKYLSS